MSTAQPATLQAGRTRVRARLRAFAFLFCATLPLELCAQAHPPYLMVDSGFPAEDFWPIAWIDNDRVLFNGVDLQAANPCETKDPRCGVRGLFNAAYVWDVRVNTVTKYKDRKFGRLCIQGGYISYTAHDRLEDDRASVYQGGFGREKKVGTPQEYGYRSRVSCRFYRKPWPSAMTTRNVEPLLERHGYIDYGPLEWSERTEEDEADRRPKLRSPEGKRIAALEFDTKYQVAKRFAYLPFEDRYFAKGDTGRVEITPAFYLTPKGDVNRIDVPQGAWGSPAYYGVLGGIFIVSGNRKSFSEPGDAGGYLYQNGAVAKVVTGSPRRVSVSPNGCRVAFVYSRSQQAQSDGYREWKKGLPGNTIRMVDLCKGGSK